MRLTADLGRFILINAGSVRLFRAAGAELSVVFAAQALSSRAQLCTKTNILMQNCFH
jgi:hypothetical protein